MSDSVRPHPWDSPGKNTGVGCHFLLQGIKVKSESEVSRSCPTLRDPMDSSLPGSSSMGFSRQEYWSGVPLPSPKLGTSNILTFTVYIILSSSLNASNTVQMYPLPSYQAQVKTTHFIHVTSCKNGNSSLALWYSATHSKQ